MNSSQPCDTRKDREKMPSHTHWYSMMILADNEALYYKLAPHPLHGAEAGTIESDGQILKLLARASFRLQAEEPVINGVAHRLHIVTVEPGGNRVQWTPVVEGGRCSHLSPWFGPVTLPEGVSEKQQTLTLVVTAVASPAASGPVSVFASPHVLARSLPMPVRRIGDAGPPIVAPE
jgi:hypothetical protein